MPIDPNILKIASSVANANPAKVDDSLSDSVDAALRYERSEPSIIKKFARKRLDEAWFPQLAAISEGIGTSVAAPIVRGFNQPLADRLQHMGSAFREEASNRDVDNTIFPPALARAGRGVAETIPIMGLSAYAGPAGIIGVASVQAEDQALTEARDAGLSGGKALGYAATQGAIEGGITGVFQMAGMGGAEKMLTGGLKGAANTGLKQGLKKVGMAGIHELPEELSISLSSNLAAKLGNVDPDAMSPERTRSTVQDTILQTGLTVAAIGAPGVIRSHRLGKLQKTADEITAVAASGEAPTRTQWKSWGFSSFGGAKASDRLRVAREIASNIQAEKAKQEAAGQAAAEIPATAPQEASQAPVAGQPVVTQPTVATQPEVTQEATEATIEPPVEPAIEPSPAIEPEAAPEPEVTQGSLPESDQELTGIKNAKVDEIRAGRGDTPISSVPAETQEQWLESAHGMISQDPDLPNDLVDELNNEPRNISDEETAVLQIHYRSLNNKYAAAYDRMIEAEEAGDTAGRVAAQAQAKKILDKIQAVEEAARAAGREWGRSGVARQMVLKNDYSLGGIMRRMRTANDGKELSADQQADAKALYDEISELNAKLEASEAARLKQDSAAGVDEAIEDTAKYILDGRKASRWMRSAVNDRAKRLGITIGGRSRKQLIAEINKVEGNVRQAAENANVSYRVLMEGIKESFPSIAEYAKMERDAKAYGHEHTGLTQANVVKLIENGYDYSVDPNKVGGKVGESLRHFDAYADEVSQHYPDLFNTWESPSEILWNILAMDVPAKIRIDSPRVLQSAVAYVENNMQGVTDADLPPIETMKIPSEYIADSIGREDANAPSRKTAKAKEKVSEAWAEFKNILAAGRKQSGGLASGESGALNVDILAVGAKLVKAYADLKVATVSEFMADAKMHLGDAADTVRGQLQEIWDNAVKAGIIQKPEIAPDDKDGIRKLARKITRSVVQSGVIEREAVVSAVHSELQQIVPDITRRQTMDAISGYGKYSELSKEDIDVTIREINGELQQLAKLDDISNKQPPSKTGVERRTPNNTERQLIQKVNEAMKRAGFGAYDKDKHLKSALDAAKTAVNNRITDLEKEIHDREPIVKERNSLVPDEELLKLRKRLEEVREIHAKMFPKKPQTQAQKIESTIKSLDRAIAQLKGELDEYLESGKIGGRKKPEQVRSPEIDDKRAQLTSLQSVREALKDIENPKIPLEQRRTDAYRRSLEKRLADLQRRVKEQDFSKKEVNHVVPDEASVELKYKIKDVKSKLKEMEVAIERANKKGLAKARLILDEALNASRAIMTSMDFSAVLRQGAFTTFSHPVLTAKALPDMFRSFYSKEGEFKAAENLRNRKNSRLYEIAKLAIQTTESSLSKQEEAFFGTWQRHIPGVAGSGRAYVTFLNRMRADVFDSLVASLGVNGEVSVEEAKVIANFVNTATGRGNIGSHGAGADLLATYLFAPRYMASRFQLLLLQPLRGGTLSTKKLIAWEYGRAMLGVGTFYGLCAIGGLFSDDEEDKPQFEIDMRSTEFGKVRFGDVIIDPLAGLSQVTTLLARVIGGKTKMSTGEIVPIRGKDRPFQGLTTFEAISRFMRGKLAPAPGAIVNILAGENIIGKEVKPVGSLITHPIQSAKELASGREVPLGALEESVIPLSFGDIYDAMHAHGITKKAALPLLVMFGVGVNRYQNATPERFAEKIAGHPKLSGRSKTTGKEFNYEKEVSQVVRQAKKRGLSDKVMADAMAAKMREEGRGSDAIRRAKLRLRNRLKEE